jgi:hypothetical protein
MNIAQLSEHLKDVPQMKLIDYAQNPNSVVPQFLALAEIQRRQQLGSPQVQAPSSTVANDVLAQANPQPMQMPQGIAQLAQPVPEMMGQQLPENQPGVSQLPSRVAPQGFAGGGIVAFAGGGMPPEQDDEDYADYVEGVEKSKRRGMIDEALASLKDRVAGVASVIPRSYEAAKKDVKAVASHGMDDLKSLLHKVSMLESGGKDYDKYGRLLTSPKGAEGRMQTLRSTQRDPGFGVTPAKDSSVEEKNRVGEEYFAAMLEKFKDPKVAAMAYNWGPGNVQKWLDSGKKTPVPQETAKYASHFSKGGIADIPKFAAGQKIALEDYYAAQDAEDQAAFAPTPLKPLDVQPAPIDRFEQFIKARQDEQEELKANRKQDMALAILQGGLGMLGGTSPYAFANIGQGAQQGVSTYASLAKQRAAELAASRKLENTALENQILGEIRKAGIEQKASSDKEAIAEKAYGRLERTKLLSSKEANDVREAALARFNADPMTKQLAKKLEDTTPGTPEFEWYTNEFNRLRDNALAQAKVPGAVMTPKASPFPTGKVEAPSAFWQTLPFTKKYSEDDLKALEWANANPLDPRANAIKERFK